jgi:LPXTG-motif cell wall-anchored protein
VSSVPTTAPTSVGAVECGPGTLACTGSSDTGAEVAVGLGLLVAGAGLLALKRRPARTR